MFWMLQDDEILGKNQLNACKDFKYFNQGLMLLNANTSNPFGILCLYLTSQSIVGALFSIELFLLQTNSNTKLRGKAQYLGLDSL